MKFFLLSAGVVLVALAVMVSGWRKDVVKFSMFSSETREIIRYLTKGTDTRNPSRLGTYSYKNCGDPKTELLNISTLIFAPDPITFPGTLEVTLAAQVKKTVDAPLKGVLQLLTKKGDTWIKIPCVAGFGSCTYDDVCQLLSGATCPPPFVAAGVPCKCPFNQGDYNLPKADFEVDAAVIPAGDYHAIANLTMSGSHVACIELYFSFA